MAYSWSEPARISQSLTDVVFRFPRLASDQTGVFVVGNDVPLFSDEIVPPNALSAARIDGAALGHPPGTWNFAYPRAAVDSSGTLHVLWGEPEGLYEPLPARVWPDEITGIWVASFSAASGWSGGRRLVQARSFDWEDQLVGDISRGADGTLAVSVLGARRVTRDTPMVLLFREGEWHTRQVNSAVTMLSSHAALTPKALYVAAIGSLEHSRVTKAVFVHRSDDWGRSWSSPVQVAEPANGRHLAEVKMLVGADQRPFLLWTDTGPRESAVRLAVATDSGASWSLATSLELDYAVRSLRATPDRSGTIHIVFEHWGAGGTDGTTSHLDYASWSGSWSAVSHLFPHLRSASGALGVGSDGCPVLVFLGQPGGGPFDAAVSSFQSRLIPSPTGRY